MRESRDEPLDLTPENPERWSDEFLEGWEAYCWGVPVSENPYQPGVRLYQEWHQGWYQASEQHGRKDASHRT